MKPITLSFNGESPRIWINPAHIMHIQVKDRRIVFTMSNGEKLDFTPESDVDAAFIHIVKSIGL